MPLCKRATAVVISSLALLAFAGAGTARADERSTLAITYQDGKGTQVDMLGAGRNAGDLGRADVKRSEGRTRVKLKLEPLPHPQSFGSLYTTYVLWAVAPEGRAENLAELPHSKAFDVDATTSLATFGLIVTAEPDSAVTRPGPRLVAQNGIRGDTRGQVQTGTVEYEAAIERQPDVRSRPDFATPLPLLGARRAVDLARGAGAADLADDELRDAEVKLQTAEQLWGGRERLSKEAESAARDAMRLAEHARSQTAERRVAAGHAAERRAAQAAIGQARGQAAEAEAQAAADRAQAAQARSEADLAAAQAAKAQASVREAQGEAEAARVGEAVARSDAAQARAEADQARQDNAALQERLYQSLSAILETRREARGLIVSLSDVLFDFDRASLTPGAREKLSRLAGILLAYPGAYSIAVEGHTDSVGTHEYNLQLSRGRAQSVSTYLAGAGIPAAKLTAVTGFGETRPVASNDTAAGRQQNRRVEIVIADLDR